MYTILLITILIICTVIIILNKNQNLIKFYTTGLDSGFVFSELNLLWKLAKVSELSEPMALFWSIPALTRSILHVIEDSKRNNTENSEKIQLFLTKLYKYRTKLEIDASQKKGFSSTSELDENQKLNIILPGKGVFSSRIATNGYNLTIALPSKKNVITMEASQWIEKLIHVYLWRKHDASYVFDTTVKGSGLYMGRPVLYLAHSENMFRTQKRQSIRSDCHIYAQMFILKSGKIDFNTVETDSGYNCLIEDISESGSLVRIGGKGIINIKIKLQFTLNNKFIVMYGKICAVEYNAKLNQSRLHIECFYIEPQMKNAILGFVYSILPTDEQEAIEAVAETEAEKMKEIQQNNESDQQENQIIIPDISSIINEEIPELASLREDEEQKVEKNENL